MTAPSLIERLEKPEICPGGYVLHAYCDHSNPAHEFDEFPWEPAHVHTRGQAVRQLRNKGWRFHRDGTATCPKCARKDTL